MLEFKSCSYWRGESKSDSHTGTPEMRIETETEEKSFPDSPSWARVDTATRKSLAEMKLRDAERLASELEELLERLIHGSVTVEMAGNAESWPDRVDFIRGEIAEAGFKVGRDNPASAMARVDYALVSMKSAWERYKRFARATSTEDSKTQASLHAGSMQSMRGSLKDAHDWLVEGTY